MKTLSKLVALCAVTMTLPGCAAVLVGGLIYHDSKTRDQRLAFTQDFQKQNFEREKAGLTPLVWCEQLYRFDQSWYGEDATCNPNASKTKPADNPTDKI